MSDVRCPMSDVGYYLLIKNRRKMNSSPMNKENIQPAFAVDGLRRGKHPTSDIQHPTNCGAFP
jgi:hypothetical protein